MNRILLRALLRDALYQVLDDKVFRLLVVLSIGLVAPTFLVAFREDRISLLFGWKTFAYADLLLSFGVAIPRSEEVQIAVIAGIQDLVVQNLVGNVGLLFCIAATAFFVPRMLEKGSADTLFSKPASRAMLLLARYASGVLFVGVLAFAIVLGMHVGFLVVSGHSDPAFLWSALSLVYPFALVHSFSVAVAVFTRSSIAAILTTLSLFVFNGCLQRVWVLKEHTQEVQRIQREGGEEADGEGPRGPLGFLFRTADGLHWILPKTHDAEVIVKKLRIAVTGPAEVLRDSRSKLVITGDPAGMSRDVETRESDLETSPAVWMASSAADPSVERVEVSRRSRLLATTDLKGRPKRQSSLAAATELSKSLESSSTVQGKPTRERRESRSSLDVEWVRWRESTADGPIARRRGFAALDDTLIVVDATLRGDEARTPDFDSRVESFAAGFRVDRADARYLKPEDWYERAFGWASPPRFNAFVSIATSIAFAVLVLSAACWRLSRIDF